MTKMWIVIGILLSLMFIGVGLSWIPLGIWSAIIATWITNLVYHRRKDGD